MMYSLLLSLCVDSRCRDLNHKNVVRLFGVVCFTPPYYMAIELPANGDLKSFLLACQDPTKSTV